MAEASVFMPIWASPPGRTIQARLDELGIGIPEFAEQLGASDKVANGLLDGSEMITVDIARRLSRLIGASAEFWVTRDCQYRDDLIRVETDRWLEDLPVKAMTKFGWIASHADWASRAEACLSFFDVEDVVSWQSRYEPTLAAARMRISSAVPSRDAAVAAWLRKATLEAEATATGSWNASLLRESFGKLKSLTWNKDPGKFVPKLRDLLASAGVALVVLRTLPGCPASGAARFLKPDRAMIVVSGRFLADDQFWFTVMHEIAHLLLHSPGQAILDDPYHSYGSDSIEEQEANQFAAEALLPSEVRDRVPGGNLNHRLVIAIARAAGVSPGIVVGQLQFAKLIGHEQMNKLKRRYQWNGANLEIA